MTRYRTPVITPLGPSTPSTWRENAACIGADPELWFPHQGVSDAPAKRICFGCPVRAECLDDALKAGKGLQGVYGGLSQAERSNVIRNRQRATQRDSETRNHAAAVARYEATRHLYATNSECRRAIADSLGVHPETVALWVRRAAEMREA